MSRATVNPQVENYKKVLSDLAAGYQGQQESPHADVFKASFDKYGTDALLMKMDESILTLNNVIQVEGGNGSIIHELQMIANLAVMGIMILEDQMTVTDFPDDDEEDPADDEAKASDDAPITVEEELEDLTKPQLLTIANKCGVVGINKKAPKSSIIEKITKEASEDDIYNAIDELDEEE